MIEAWGLEDYSIPTLLLAAGLLLGLVFGAAAQISRFCLRRAVAGDSRAERVDAGGTWSLALAVAILATQAALWFELVDLSDTRFVASGLPLAALALGGALFGVGMVLSRGCPSRLLILGSSGNLRAALVFLVFSVVAYATLRGVFAPAAVWLRDAGGVDGAGGYLAELLGMQGAAPIIAAVAALALLTIAWRSGASARDLALGGVVGLTICGGWLATGFVLLDEFDPRPADSLAFTAGGADTLFYFMVATALEPGFGLGVVLGAVLGAHLSARLRGEVKMESFSSPRQTSRYLLGGALMGVGGVLAGGCTVGAGLTGVSTLGLAPIIALLSIIAGATATKALQGSASQERAAAMTPAQ